MSLGRRHDASLTVLNRLFQVIGISTGLLLAFPVMLILCVTVKQREKDRDYEAQLRPSIDFVYAFQKAKHRLPSSEEFGARPSAGADFMVDLSTKDSFDTAFKSEGGRTANDFCVRIWRGESWTYYFSWKDSFGIVEP